MRVIAVLTSSDFDTYLYVESPGGVERKNDDYGEDGTNSRLEFVSSENGEWKFKVTSSEDNAEGYYRLTIAKEYLGEVTAYSGVLDKDDPISNERGILRLLFLHGQGEPAHCHYHGI